MTNQTVNRSTTEITPGYLNIMGYVDSSEVKRSWQSRGGVGARMRLRCAHATRTGMSRMF